MSITFNAIASSVTAADTTASKPPKKIAEAATQFESLMIAQMLKTERETSGGGWLSDGDQAGEDSSMGMAEDLFAQTLAKNGGLGLAKMVIQTMSHVSAGTESLPATRPAK